jgi:hypothetical protein
MRVIGLALLGLGLALATPLQAGELPRDAIDAVLTRALVERAAFRACAGYESNSEAEAALVRGWKLDLAETAEALRKAGYPDGDARSLIARLDIDKATPKFTSREALGAFCATLGDWKKRFELLLGALPQQEVRRVLKP